MAYKRGENRDQISFLPESLEDYVSDNAVVRFWEELPAEESEEQLAEAGVIPQQQIDSLRATPVSKAPAEEGVVLGLHDISEQAGLSWDSLGVKLKQHGRLHMETY